MVVFALLLKDQAEQEEPGGPENSGKSGSKREKKVAVADGGEEGFEPRADDLD